MMLSSFSSLLQFVFFFFGCSDSQYLSFQLQPYLFSIVLSNGVFKNYASDFIKSTQQITTIEFSEQNGSEQKTPEYITKSKLCFVNFCFYFMCVCLYILGHCENEFLTMDHSQKTLKDSLAYTSYYSQQLSFKYLHRTVLPKLCSKHLCVYTCVSLPRIIGPPLLPMANSFSDVKTHIRCFFLCIAFHKTLRFIQKFCMLYFFRYICLPLWGNGHIVL